MTPDAVNPGSPISRRRQVASIVILVVGLVGLGVVTRGALRDARDVSLPGPGSLGVCFVLTRAALSCSAHAWATLVGQPADGRRVIGAFYNSQLVKYLPAGGAIQAAGQVGMTAVRGVSVRRATLAYLSFVVATIVAGLTIGAGLALVGDVHPALRLAAVLGVAMPLLLDRRLFAIALRAGRRVTRRIPEPELLPDQRSLWVALLWSGANHALYAAGFTALLHAVSPDVPLLAATVAYVVSWVVGFLVLPLPSGVGVREAVLVVLVPSVSAGPLLAASLAQRLVSIVAEVVAALGSRVGRLRHR